MKTVLFVPGFKEHLTTRDYGKVIEVFERQGHVVVFVPIQWRYTNINDWVAQSEEVYAQYDPANTILAGFSFGAVVAFVAAAKRPPSELWLCSLSPFFDDDRGLPSPNDDIVRRFGKRRLEAFKQLKYTNIMERIPCKTLVFYGTNERLELVRRSKVTAQKLTQAELIEVKGAGHEIEHPSYIATIAEAIARRKNK